MSFLRLLLLPFSLIYLFLVTTRNKLYDWGWLQTEEFQFPVICVGNLLVGGTGKTPMTEYLVRLLQVEHKVAILSRGYGRQTRGYIEVSVNSTPQQVGDEPLQFKKKFPAIKVAVCEDRAKGIKKLLSQADIILLDDGFQHRSVRAGLNLLLFDYPRLTKTKLVLPAGDLREPLSGIERADALVVTKNHLVKPADLATMVKTHLKPGNKPVFYSFLRYGDPLPIFETSAPCSFTNVTVFLITGIANSGPLVEYLEKMNAKVIQHKYPDHHQFTIKNISKLVQDFEEHNGNDKVLITTEKDFQRLSAPGFKTMLHGLPFYYLPVEADFFDDSKELFNQLILNYVKKHTVNN